MQAEIITIGDELLIGQVIDSNSAYIAQELNKVGITVYQITSVQDDQNHILDTLKAAQNRSALVILTGGLGPTKDDITKATLCRFFQDTLVQNDAVLTHIEQLFQKHITHPISNLNRQQALVPSRATVLHNPYGTAPGLWMKKEATTYVSLPGVPFEMKHLLTHTVLPKIVEEYERPFVIHRTLLTYGLGESAIAHKIELWENTLPPFIKLAYLPGLGKVRLRLTAKGTDKEGLTTVMETEVEKLRQLLGDIFYGEEEKGSLEKQIAKALTEKQLTLATAESFTGGKLAERLTAIPGASAYFKGSIVSYATEAKIQLLHVPEALIQKHSVVSEAVAIVMARNARNLLNTDFAIATTGNAGPTKGDSNAEIGTVCISISTPQHTFAQKFSMGNHRKSIVQKSVHKAFELLYKEILKF